MVSASPAYCQNLDGLLGEFLSLLFPLPLNPLHVLIPGLALLGSSDSFLPHVKPERSRVIQMHPARGCEGGLYWSFSFPILLPTSWGRAARGLEPRGTTQCLEKETKKSQTQLRNVIPFQTTHGTIPSACRDLHP